MPLFVIYLEKLSISLSAVWLFYQLVLRRLTFYSWNRWYLLGYAALAFFIPAVNVAGIVENGHLGSAAVIRYIPVIGDPKNIQAPRPIAVAASGRLAGFTSWDWLLAVLVLGSAILLIRLSVRWVSLSRLRRRSTLIGNMGISAVKIYQVEGRIVPFSFGDAIYINRRQHSEKEWEEIILHEYVHIRQRHTVDILLAELLCILNWYNPFAWLIRHCIRQNLEFIADGKVLENGHDKKGYQYHLLQVIGESRYRLANNFNFSSLKKRIIMMNKIRTAPLHLVKFLFVLPLLAVLLVAFRSRHAAAPTKHTPLRTETKANQKTTLEITNTAPAMDSIPADKDAGKESPARVPPMGVPRITIPLQPAMRPHPDSLHQPIWFVDGMESVNGRDPRGGPLDKINPSNIEHIDVVGPDSARKVYGEKGKNGAIFIYMKKTIKDSVMILNASKDSVSVTVQKDTLIARSAVATASARNSLRAADSFKGLIMLNGKEISKSALSNLDTSKLKSYTIIGGDVAVKQYGEKARDGVIVIVSK
jgi:hypothetical protein